MPRFVDISGAAPIAAAATVRAAIDAAQEDQAFYVSPTGSDSAAGSVDAPFATIPYAVSQLTAGDTLYILEGEYDQPDAGAVFVASGTPARHITVQGVGTVLIECADTITYSGEVVASNFSPAFDTDGHSFIDFKDFTVANVRSAVTVNTGSSHVTIDGVDADRCHFGFLIYGASHVTVTNSTITDCRSGVMTDAPDSVVPTDLVFTDMTVSGSKNVFSGWETGYRNGDGFIFEYGDRIVVRDVVTHDNWDAGLDIKADNVTVERVESYSNGHNGVKLWGDDIVLRNCVIRDTEATLDDPVTADGNGVNMRTGSATLINTTISNSYWTDIKMGTDIGGSSPPVLTLRNCIVARNVGSVTLSGVSSRCLLHLSAAGTFTETNTLWYDAVRGNAGTVNGVTLTLDGSSVFDVPGFVDHAGSDLHLTASSPAIGLGSSSYDAGTTDFDGNTRILSDGVDAGAFTTETLTRKTLRGTRESVYAITDGAAFEIDPGNGGIQTLTLGASRTPKATSFAEGHSMMLMVAATSYTITWTDGTLNPTWIGGAAPTLSASDQTVISLWKAGSTIYGSLVGYA